jgi:hypothetical protein
MTLWNRVRLHAPSPIGAVLTGWAAWLGLELAARYLAFVPVYYLIHQLPPAYASIAGQAAAVLFGVPRVLAVSIGVGWIVGRLHRPHQKTAVFSFVVTYVLWEGAWLGRLVVDAVGDSRYVAALLSESTIVLIAVFGVVLGGAWSTPSDEGSLGRARRLLS